ncbi:MAG: YceD family protein [Actinocrinis sp.]
MPAPQKPRRPDARSPFVFDVRDLGRRAGSMRQFDRDVPASDLLGAKGTMDDLYSTQGADLLLDLRIESVVEGVLATARISGDLAAQCVRCLDPVEVEVDADFQELFYYDAADLSEEEVQEGQFVIEDLIDVEALAHDAIMLELPLQPLCQDDCPGLCAECGARLADDPEHGHDTVDPRWAALSGLTLPGGGREAAGEPGEQ